MVTEHNRKIILEDGQEYCGYGFGAAAGYARSCSILRWSVIRRSSPILPIPIRLS